jgi:hypothetical protein
VPTFVKGERLEQRWVAVKWGLRLFTKNTGLCELGRGRIGSDACPVLEG